MRTGGGAESPFPQVMSVARSAALGAILVVVSACAAPPAIGAPVRLVWSGGDLVKRLRGHQALLLPDDSTIRGDLDLTPLRSVDAAVRCRDCRLYGRLLAPGVVFTQPVDLSGLYVSRDVDLSDATFDSTLLL